MVAGQQHPLALPPEGVDASAVTSSDPSSSSSAAHPPRRGSNSPTPFPLPGLAMPTSTGSKKKILAHRDIVEEAHYRELLEQGKLRHGSIVKRSDRRRQGSRGENVVLNLDGQVTGRLPRSLSQGSLSSPSQSLSLSVDVSHSSVSLSTTNHDAADGVVGATAGTGTAAATTATPTSSYTVREREQLEETWVIIVNGLKKKEWERRCARLLNQLSLVKWRVYTTRYPGHATKVATRAANKGAHMIIAAGGQGTVDEVVDGMLRSHCRDESGLPKAVLSVLPLGRANDFHRSMGWDPESFEDGLWRIGRGHTAVVDVGKVTCIGADGVPMARHFLNVASVGSNAKVCARLDNYGMFGRLRHTVASVFETWKHVVFKPRVDVVVSYDEGEWEHIKDLTLLAACNGCSFSRGKKLSVSAHPFNGTIDMVAVNSTGSLFSVGRVFQRMGEGTPERSRHISSRPCHTVDVLPSDRRGRPLVTEVGGFGGLGAGEAMLERNHSDERAGEKGMPHTESAASLNSHASELDGGSMPNPSSSSHSSTRNARVHQARIKRLVAKASHPVEIGGTVVGELPATFAVVQSAIKLRVGTEKNES